MIPLLSLFALCAGAVLVLDDAPWFSQRSLTERLRPYSRRSEQRTPRASARPMLDLVVPGIDAAARGLSGVLGIDTPLATRLERAASDVSPESFRLRQALHALLAALATILLALWFEPPATLGIAAVVTSPLMAVLVDEQVLHRRIEQRSERLIAELPVIVEQLGMLLAAGYSVPGAIDRLAQRTDGAIATELRSVVRRIRHGLSVDAALDEWARRCDLVPVQRLVHVLSLHDDAGDLASLVAEEARTVRGEAHRDLLEDIERRAQLVWVPVTVATLLPGLIFLAVPFMSALSQVAGGR